MKIYTKTGDDGTTSLFGGGRLRKDAPRIEAYGEIDELNAALGVALAQLSDSAQRVRGWLTAIQSDLFLIGTLLATPPNEAPQATLPAVRVEALEQSIDAMEKDLKPLKNFVLPQGSSGVASAHLARAVARRAERRVVALAAQEKVDPGVGVYLNRLSDFLFVVARWVHAKEGGVETAWINPSGDASAGPQPDRLAASLQKLQADKERRKSLFEKAATDLQKRKQEAEKSFEEQVDQIKKEGGTVEKPIRPMDLD
jgi:cob(I)alamin adenosyltransferase